MVQFNFSERTIKAKVVYYGPAQSGKTTNLEQLHRLTDPQGANVMVSLPTDQDRTLFFDLLPFSLGSVSGYGLMVQLFTVPGQAKYNQTRRVVLAGVDAVVFVADSRRAMLKEDVAALDNLKVNLLANRKTLERTPLVLQYNKQDLAELATLEELNKKLNFVDCPYFTSVASRGEGVMETFVAVVKLMLQDITKKYDLKSKGLDPASIPQLVDGAFEAVVQKAAEAPVPDQAAAPPARLVVAHSVAAESSAPVGSSADSVVSEELLQRAIHSNVQLAEALGGLVQDMNVGLSTILSHAELLMVYREDAREKRSAATAAIQAEANRLRRLMQQLGQAGATASGETMAASSAAARAPSRVERVAASRSVPARDGSASAVDEAVREGIALVRGALEASGLQVELRVLSTPLSPRVPAQSVTRAVAGLLEGLAALSPAGAVVQIKAERKPVLLKSKDGSEVKREFLMLAAAHGGVLSADQQQRALQGADPGPIGLACKAVKDLGGFVRFAPLSGGGLETRFFLPAT